MKKSESKVYKLKLLAMQARLRGDVSHLTDTALKRGGKHSDSGSDLARMPIHMADIGSENFDQEFSLSLLENDESALDSISHALDKIADCTYGECDECGCKIPKMRLEAIPYAVLCVKCAGKAEA